MDDGDVDEVRWAPRPAGVAATGAAGLLLAVLAVLAADPAGRFLLGLAALGLLGAGTAGAVLRPRLRAGPDGLAVRGPGGTRVLRWDEVAQVEVVSTRRLGREVPVLEISPRDTPQASGQLLLLTRTDLGADPRDVLEALHAQRAR